MLRIPSATGSRCSSRMAKSEVHRMTPDPLRRHPVAFVNSRAIAPQDRHPHVASPPARYCSRRGLLMRRVSIVWLALLMASASWRTGAQTAPPWDERYRAIPDAVAIGQYMERLSARPHHVGAPYTR